MENSQEVEIFDNEIDMYLQEFCDIHKPPIDDLTNCPQNVWSGAMMYIYRRMFKGTDRLLNNNNIYMSKGAIYSNMYDYNKCLDICEYYIYICGLYNKVPSIIDYCHLTGIDNDTITEWGKDKPSHPRARIYKKLRGFRENCLTNRLIDTKQAVGLIAIQNREYGWNDAGGAAAGSATIALTASDVRKLLESNCAKLPDNSAQAEAIEVDCTVSNCANNSNNLGQAENVGNKPLLSGNNTE